MNPFFSGSVEGKIRKVVFVTREHFICHNGNQFIVTYIPSIRRHFTSTVNSLPHHFVTFYFVDERRHHQSWKLFNSQKNPSKIFNECVRVSLEVKFSFHSLLSLDVLLKLLILHGHLSDLTRVWFPTKHLSLNVMFLEKVAKWKNQTQELCIVNTFTAECVLIPFLLFFSSFQLSSSFEAYFSDSIEIFELHDFFLSPRKE